MKCWKKNSHGSCTAKANKSLKPIILTSIGKQLSSAVINDRNPVEKLFKRRFLKDRSWPIFVITLKHLVIKFRIAEGVLREYLIYFHQARNHQGKGNVLLFPLNRQLAPDEN